MKKIVGGDFSFFGDGADALMPAWATTFINLNDVSAANQTIPLSATGFMQASDVAVPVIGPIASNASSAANVFASHSSLAQFAKPESIATSDGDRIAVNGAMSDVQSGDTTFAITSPETVTTPGSGFVFINTYNSGVTQVYHDSIVAAEHYLESHFTNTVTVRTTFDLQDIDHRFSGENSFSPVHVAYSTFVNALQSHATSADDLAAVAALKNLSDPSGGAGFSVSIGEARALGLAGSGSSTDDTIILNSFYWTAAALQNSPTDATAVLEHELTEGIMGRVGGHWAPMDLFRFTASGQRDFTGGSDGLKTYFSTDGSNVYTGLQYHAPTASGSNDGFDWADWDQVGDDANARDPFGPGGPGVGDPGTLSATDIRIMDVLGWNLAAAAPSISINDMTITEGNSGTQVMTFTVTRSGGTAAFAVNFATADGTATTADHDYVANSGTLNFGAGVNTQTISVTINGDTKLENSETFHVNLSGATNGAVISDNSALGTIANDEGTRSPHEFNGDGNNDFLWRNDSGSVATWDMNDRSSNGAAIATVTNDWHIADTGDFNGDGRSDILWRNDSGAVATWDMNDRSYAGLVIANVSNDWHIAGTGDFNGDHKTDILWRNDSGAVATWDMNDRSYSGLVIATTPNDWHIAGTGDFNGDGKSDILWRNDSGAVATWDMNDRSSSGAVIANVSNDWHIADTGDFNGDGKTDILWRNDSGAVATWDMNDRSYAGLVVANVSNDWHIAETGDFNGDHKTDILWRNDSGAVATWDMNDRSYSGLVIATTPNDWHIV